MRRLPRHRELLPGHDRELDLPAIVWLVSVALQPQASELRARAEQTGLRRRSSSATRRTLWNHRERQRFAEREPIGRLAEVQAARCTDTLNVAAEWHDIHVRFEQLAFRIPRLEPERGTSLPN